MDFAGHYRIVEGYLSCFLVRQSWTLRLMAAGRSYASLTAPGVFFIIPSSAELFSPKVAANA